MVLSNRKLKQKLREELAQSLVESVSKTDPKIDGSENPDSNSHPPSLKVLLDSETQKPRLSKREKRRKLRALRGPEDGGGGNLEENKGEEDKGEVGSDEKKKKRKRDEEGENGDLGSEENGVVKETKKPKKKSKKKKNKKRKKEAKSEDQSVKETENNIDRQANGEVSTKAYVEGIPYYSTEDDIRSYFESCGTITEVDCLRFPDSGKFRGMAILSFKTEAAAKRALALDGAEMGELFLKVQPYMTTRTGEFRGYVHLNIDRQASGDVPSKVYVGGIPYYSTEDDIRSYFESCGTVTEVDCLRFPDSGKFRGIAILSFKTEAAAKLALALDGAEMGELFLKVQPFKTTRTNKVPDFAPQMVEGYNRIYVGNLSWDITEDDLTKLFSDCKISSINFGKDKETGEFRGYAHVNFADSLSVTIALKLDQNVVCGRPVKISCAVPLKKAGPPSTSTPTTSSIHPVSVGTITHANSIPVDTITSTEADNGGLTAAISGKIKRRTCYECGEKGHLSSACPKSATKASNTHSIPVSTTTSADPLPVATTTSTTPIPEATTTGTGADYGGLSAISGKIKRRTCYECGEKGHLSSACPKSATATSSNHSISVPTSTKPIPVATNTNMDWMPVAITTGAEAENGGLSASSGTIKRRTCYECGEKGHISSACPKSATTSSIHAMPIASSTRTNPIPVPTTTSTALMPEATSTGTGADNGGLSAMSGKIKRRTCYECGEKGHISSACPKKQSGGPMDTNAS